MFLRIGRYLMSDGYLIWISLLILGMLLTGFYLSWAHGLGVALFFFLVDHLRESYNRCPWRFRNRFSQ